MSKKIVIRTRPLKKENLPRYRTSCRSLRTPVIYKGEFRRICDTIDVGPDTDKVYLEGAKGEPTPIKDLELITTKGIRDDDEIIIEQGSKVDETPSLLSHPKQ